MNLRSLIATGTLAALLIPVSSFAANPAVKQYQEVHGPFETMEDAEVACMRAVGFDERAIRLYTGNIGYNWEVEDPLTFYVRRCLNNVRKEAYNQRFAEQREARKQARMERIIYPKTMKKIESNKINIQNRIYDNVRTRASQHTRTPVGIVKTHEDIRSLRRVDMRAKEREIRDRLNRKKTFQQEAQEACKQKRGTQRVMCIRKEVREREEALYDSGE